MYGKHICPSCKKTSILKGALLEYMAIWISMVVVVALFTFGLLRLNSDYFSENIVVAFSIVVSIVIIAPLDKIYYSKREKLEKIPHQ